VKWSWFMKNRNKKYVPRYLMYSPQMKRKFTVFNFFMRVERQADRQTDDCIKARRWTAWAWPCRNSIISYACLSVALCLSNSPFSKGCIAGLRILHLNKLWMTLEQLRQGLAPINCFNRQALIDTHRNQQTVCLKFYSALLKLIFIIFLT